MSRESSSNSTWTLHKAARLLIATMFNMIKQALIILIMVFPLRSYGEGSDELEEAQKELCNRSAVEVDITNTVAEAGWYSDVLVKLLSGNMDEATDQLSFMLSVNVMSLYSAVIVNPCNADKKLLEKALPMLRVVAAVNNKTPLPGWSDNKLALEALEYAIKENPQHYKDLVERSNNWEHGIK